MRRISRRRRLLRSAVLLAALALVAGAVYGVADVLQRSETLVTERCTAVVGSDRYELDIDQAGNAALITAVSVRRGLPPRAATIALATAMQESKLRNIDHGDQAGPDSRGLFQQRPSQGWGTEAQIMDPEYASNAFYDGLVKVPGYETMEITQAAQLVQKSAFPRAYAQHEAMGRAYASALTGHSAEGLDCVLKTATTVGDPDVVADKLAAEFGALPTATGGRTVTIAASGVQAWALAQWAVANAKELSVTQVDVDGKRWSRQERDGWQTSAQPPGSVVITVSAPITA
ncbi:hypothetical protein [Arthrobacter sp. M4]|uniref:hypothetical protein n=1 Tax=Arthrobacter sp. M4 TaxID=218160 RepID=UPI001CDD494A|nr:hypothetical protein [Arthrobacter sp. M4]MCA4132377.1 hypothetical protein [Arthrobacter sp. M4]